jgi:hypothetical protein
VAADGDATEKESETKASNEAHSDHQAAYSNYTRINQTLRFPSWFFSSVFSWRYT